MLQPTLRPTATVCLGPITRIMASSVAIAQAVTCLLRLLEHPQPGPQAYKLRLAAKRSPNTSPRPRLSDMRAPRAGARMRSPLRPARTKQTVVWLAQWLRSLHTATMIRLTRLDTPVKAEAQPCRPRNGLIKSCYGPPYPADSEATLALPRLTQTEI